MRRADNPFGAGCVRTYPAFNLQREPEETAVHLSSLSAMFKLSNVTAIFALLRWIHDANDHVSSLILRIRRIATTAGTPANDPYTKCTADAFRHSCCNNSFLKFTSANNTSQVESM